MAKGSEQSACMCMCMRMCMCMCMYPLAQAWLIGPGRLLEPGARVRVARPLLRVGQMRDRVEVGHDELAARVLVDAQLVRGK